MSNDEPESAIEHFKKRYPDLILDEIIEDGPDRYGSIFHDGGSAIMLAAAIAERMKEQIIFINKEFLRTADEDVLFKRIIARLADSLGTERWLRFLDDLGCIIDDRYYHPDDDEPYIHCERCLYYFDNVKGEPTGKTEGGEDGEPTLTEERFVCPMCGLVQTIMTFPIDDT